MSEKLSTELRKWFLSLGFEEKNFSAEQIEDEFSRLSPPEMRDIWRNVMTHVVPTNKPRYIKKLLLLNELKKFNKNLKQRQRITKNVDTIEKFDEYRKFENMFLQLDVYLKSIVEANTKVKKQKLVIGDLENSLSSITKENEKENNVHTLSNLKIRSHGQKADELFEINSYIEYVNSLWHTKHGDGKKTSAGCSDIFKDILRKLNEFSKRRDNLTEANLINEQEALMIEVMKLTSDSSTSELHKIVINMLKDTLSAVLKLSDHVSVKHEPDNISYVQQKLTHLKKQCVDLFVDNLSKKEYVAKHVENVGNQRNKLLSIMRTTLDGDSQKNVETWLDSECLKFCMTKRLEFLRKKEEALKTSLPPSAFVLADGLNKEKLFKNTKDCRNQLILLEEELTSNLYHLSDEPINVFIDCQNCCKVRIKQFIYDENSSRHLELTTKLGDSLKSEIALLRKVDLSSCANNTLIMKTESSEITPSHRISQFIRKCSFLLHLSYAWNNMHRKAFSTISSEIIEKKSVTVKNEENGFVEEIQKLIAEAKDNLRSIEEHSKTCSNNLEIWTQSSANEIIPKQMLAADRTFVEWQKRYLSVIQYLRKQQQELNKYSK